MFQAHTHLTNSCRLFDCISSTAYRSPFCHTVLNANGRVYTVTCLRFFYLFSHTSSTPFHICASLFSPSFCSIIFFFIVLFLYSHFYAHFFHRPQLYSSTRFIRRDHLLACLLQFSFVSILAQRQASHKSYTSLLPQSSCHHAYFVHYKMVSS